MARFKYSFITALAVVCVGGLSILQGQAASVATTHGIRLDMVPNEEGSPMTLMGAKSTVGTPFAEVTVRNEALKSVRSAVFGLVWQSPDGGGPRLVGQTDPVALNVASHKSATASLHFPQIDEVNALAARTGAGALELGVLAATFADGSGWTFDLTSHVSFSGVRSYIDAGGEELCSTTAHSGVVLTAYRALARLGIPGGGGFFSCAASSYPVFCENFYSSCTDELCPAPPAGCPQQECKYNPPPAPVAANGDEDVR